MAARRKPAKPKRADRDELLARLDLESKAGSVAATKLLLEELRRDADADHDDKPSKLDALDNVTPITTRRKSAKAG